jgi:phosphate starvation-inducible PhoH-like protein
MNGSSSNGAGKKNIKPRIVRAKTEGQRVYMEAIESCDIVYCLGPAGTGKTHIAAGMAARFFNEGDYERIVAVRPAVEAGNSLGFLPGELDDKIKPYLRPFLGELAKFIPEEELRRLRQGELPRVELSPLQYMRGSTLENSIIVLDEAQNATKAEIWMFLTRLGEGSKMIINGDTSHHEDGTMKQCDLPRELQGGVEYYADLYADYDEIGIVTMTEADIVRHKLVRKMMQRS